MCQMDQIAACEIAFIPIGTAEYLEPIEEVLELIKQSGLAYDIGAMTTFIRGHYTDILKLVENIYQTLNTTTKFSMEIKLSNLCGCD